jgi:hypothetical protein
LTLEKNLEHAMHPQGGGGFKGFASAAGPLASCFVEAGEPQVCKTVKEHGLETQAVNLR